MGVNDFLSNKRGMRNVLPWAVLSAFAIRLAYLLITRRAIDMPDAIHYLAMAGQFASGDFLGFDDNLPLLYSLLGAAAHLVFRNWEHAFWAVSLIASALLVVPVYLLAREMHGRRAAWTVALLVACWPWLVDYGSRIAPEALSVTLFFSSIWLLYRAIEHGGAYVYVAPVSFFLLHLTRPEGTFLMMGAPLGALVLCVKRDRLFYKRWAVFLIGCVLLLAAYALFMRVAIGTATVSYRAPMAGDLVDYFNYGAIEFARTTRTLFFNVLPVMLGPLLLLFLGVGLFSASDASRRYRLEALVLFFCAIQWALTLANFSPAPRYIMPVVVALSMWSARGIVIVAKQAAESRHGAWLRHVPLAVVMCSLLVGLAIDLGSESLGGLPRTPREYRIAGHWLKENAEPGYIVCRKPQVGFYAEMPSIGSEVDADPEGVVAFAMDIGARYLVLDERYSAGIVPGLRPLLDPSHAPTDLKLLRDDLSPYDGAKIVIYEFVPPGIRYLTPDEFPGTSSHMGPYERRRKDSPEIARPDGTP